VSVPSPPPHPIRASPLYCHRDSRVKLFISHVALQRRYRQFFFPSRWRTLTLRSPPPKRSRVPMRWIPQEKDPTLTSRSEQRPALFSPPPKRSLEPLEWIPQDKDPTQASHSAQGPTFCGPPHKRSLEPLEWISQAKDPTTDSTEIVQLAGSTVEQAVHQRRLSDTNSTQPSSLVATRILSIISRIRRMFHSRPRATEVQKVRERNRY